MVEKRSLTFDYDQEKDIITIEGINYSGDFFRALGEDGLPIGIPFVISKRGNGIFLIEYALRNGKQN